MLTYIDTKKGNDTLVFIHSYLWDKTMWEPQINYFKDKYRCVSIDLVGHGDSKAKPDEISFEKIAKDITSLLENLKIDKFIYIGLSVGGMLAPYIYNRNKEKIKALILMDTYLGSEPLETQKLYFQMLDTIETSKKIPPMLVEKIAPLFFSPNIIQNNSLLIKNFKYYLGNISQSQIECIVKFGRLIFGRVSTLNFLSSIESLPIYFITGEFDIPRPYKEAEEMYKLSLNSQIFKISNAGHISNLENPKETNKVLEEILDSLN